ncbi:unnamed protein product [Moneuplotes crassus]|uniref:Ubiquitin-like domain-containing protein n=1 Tax=Euplotes crassus TaxID=5936 RepID=A0AAD2D0Y9_EUPCR|nr:unnamed protein product [Moneuplotes crassus]
MEIIVKNRKGKQLVALTLDKGMTVKDLKELYLKQATEEPISLNRQYYTLNEVKGQPLNDDTKKLSTYNIKKGDTLYLKDLGLQISWKLVFLIEYFGPIGIFLLFFRLRNLIYGQGSAAIPLTFTQKAGFFMVLGHFIKRELETLFIHRFSSTTMPLKNLLINCTHYWFTFALLVGYFLFHPKYTEPEYSSMNVKYVLIVLFTFFQTMNFLCHNQLKNLRKPGTTERGIPQGYGFGLVSCANYFWETLVWLSYSIFTGTATSYLFCAFSFYQMADWALKKHGRYKKEFKDYPKNRTAIVPFVL